MTTLGIRRPASIDTAHVGHLAVFAGAWFAAFVLIGVAMEGRPWPLAGAGADVHAYWSAWQGGLYAASPALDVANYIYPPPLAQLIYPATLLPLPAFALLWLALEWAVLWWMLLPVRRSLRVPLFLALAAISGNAAVFVVLALASRRAAAWALPLLTKLTPGVGLLWYAIRREWRSLTVALGATALIAGTSFALGPALWIHWVDAMLANGREAGGLMAPWLPAVPLAVRVLLAAALVAWGARTDRRWTVAVAALVASPDMLLSSVPLLAAVPRLCLRSPTAESGLLEPRAGSPGAVAGSSARLTA